MDLIDKELQELLNDPLLKDVNQSTTLSQVKNLIQLEKGSLIKLTLLRGPLERIELTLNENSTLLDLKIQIEQKINSLIKSKRLNLKINWKFTWSRNKLSTLNNLELNGDKSTLRELGLKHNELLKFARVKKARSKLK